MKRIILPVLFSLISWYSAYSQCASIECTNYAIGFEMNYEIWPGVYADIQAAQNLDFNEWNCPCPGEASWMWKIVSCDALYIDYHSGYTYDGTLTPDLIVKFSGKYYKPNPNQDGVNQDPISATWGWVEVAEPTGGGGTDTDGDGTPDASDGCPNDANKIAPGDCGCGVEDTDTDGDGVKDCDDVCSSGDDTQDMDNDGIPDACDTDRDGDGVDNVSDCFPDDASKSAEGIWYEDADSDGAGDPSSTLSSCAQPAGYIATAGDGCPNDPNKTTPGDCGCGAAETDTDGDGVKDCVDACPSGDDTQDMDNDGIPDACDTDRDGDEVPNSSDCFPDDPLQSAEGTWYEDADNDGAGDPGSTLSSCAQPAGYIATAGDGCPNDPNKTAPGDCGCGVADADTDGDGVKDCNDICAAGDDNIDSDGDGTPDACESASHGSSVLNDLRLTEKLVIAGDAATTVDEKFQIYSVGNDTYFKRGYLKMGPPVNAQTSLGLRLSNDGRCRIGQINESNEMSDYVLEVTSTSSPYGSTWSDLIKASTFSGDAISLFSATGVAVNASAGQYQSYIGYSGKFTGGQFLISSKSGADASVPQFFMAQDGRIGIGTTAPAVSFDIQKTDAIRVPSGTSLERPVSASNGMLRFNTESGNFEYYVETIGWKDFGSGSGSGSTLWSSNAEGIFYNDGTVGIGVETAPAGFKLAVNGGIAATSVKVKSAGTWEWPDYVFADDYKLRSLKDLESFVARNKHLPEIPSQNVVEKDGVDLGEMNALLLRKVEELTLYLIEQNDKIENQQLLLNDLQKELQQLKK